MTDSRRKSLQEVARLLGKLKGAVEIIYRQEEAELDSFPPQMNETMTALVVVNTHLDDALTRIWEIIM